MDFFSTLSDERLNGYFQERKGYESQWMKFEGRVMFFTIEIFFCFLLRKWMRKEKTDALHIS